MWGTEESGGRPGGMVMEIMTCFGMMSSMEIGRRKMIITDLIMVLLLPEDLGEMMIQGLCLKNLISHHCSNGD